MKRLFFIAIIASAFCVTANAQYSDWADFRRYSEINASLSIKPRAVFMGDSITDNWARFDSGFFSENNFAGRGISGQTTSQMLVRFRRDVIALAPKYVVILAGTNDIAKNNGDISLENILGNIISMCELARLHKIRPIICSVLPADHYEWRPELRPAAEIVRLNLMLREYAKSQKIPFVDYHSVLKDENDAMPAKYASDGVHPNVDCYRIMEDIILRCMDRRRSTQNENL